jgi:hypothetical protein
MRYAILTCVFLGLSTGCSVRGFSNLPDGPATPSTLRSAAAVARAEADALDQIADQNEGVIRQVVGAVQQAADGLGAPAIVSGLIGAAGGFLVPTPGQRRREKVAAAEAASKTPKA